MFGYASNVVLRAFHTTIQQKMPKHILSIEQSEAQIKIEGSGGSGGGMYFFFYCKCSQTLWNLEV